MKPLFLLCIIALSLNLQTRAQCCSAGNPSSDGGTSGMSKNSFAVSSTFIHSYSDTYLEGSSPSDYVYLNNTNFDFGLLAFNYGLTNKLSISTELGYFIDKSIEFSFIDAKRKAGGLGDAAIGIQYHLDSFKEQMINVSSSLKLSVPIGQFDQMDGNIILPIDIQPSSGSYKLKSSFMIHKGFFGSKFSLSTYWSSEFSQRINTERTDYKYGNLYNLGFKVSHRTSKKLNSGLSLLIAHREKAGNNSVLMNSTGGSFLNLQPSISYQMKNNYSVNSSVNIPVYRNVNGIQLVNKYVLALGISKGFQLKTIKSQIDYTILESLNERTVFVDGICGMCQERIETLAYKMKGVKWAEWDLETKTLSLKFKDVLNEEKLAKILSKAGHDNWYLKAGEKAYQNLHSCCKYRTAH
jgi:copper chaperone CopZ